MCQSDAAIHDIYEVLINHLAGDGIIFHTQMYGVYVKLQRASRVCTVLACTL